MHKSNHLSPILYALAVVALMLGCGQQSVSSGNIEDAVQVASRGQEVTNAENDATAVLAGGCFWCVEADFQKLPGVTDVVSGYSGGTTDDPTYENYAAGDHVEVVKVTYDPTQVTFAGLVEWLIKHSDPTDGQGSFADRGPQYRPVVYYETEAEKQAAEEVIDAVNKMNVYDQKLALEVASQPKFWPAENYHQDYAKRSWVKYDFYRYKSGRDAFIEKHWGDRAKKLELTNSTPKDNANAEKNVTGAAVDQASAKNTSETRDADKPWDDFRKPSPQQLKKKLTDVQYKVTQEDSTEPAFQNKFWDNKEAGIYVDLISGEPLFSSTDKFKSGTGWPSFVRPLDKNFIELREDNTLLTTRTEVRSKIANSHIGHVFNDGPPDRGGQRWCMNSAALEFIPKDKMKAAGYGEYLPLVGPPKETK